MMRRSTTALILALVIGVTASATATEIYRWTDKDGNAQYGDRPTEGAIRLTSIKSRSTSNTGITAARQDRQTATDEAAANEPPSPSRAELRAEAKEKAAQCQTFRDRLEKMITSRRLYREDDNGERVYLGDDEMQAARDQVQSQVKEHCSS